MTSRASIFLSRTVPPAGRALLEPEFSIREWTGDGFITREALLQGVVGANALIVHPPDRVDKLVLDAAGSQLKVISTMSVGLEHIDIAECRRRGISVGYTPGVLTETTAELTLALLLATSRRIKEGFKAVEKGMVGWQNGHWLCGKQINGCTVGIVGLGRIGLAVAKRLQPFGVAKFLYSGHSEKPGGTEIGATFVSFDELLRNSDFVVACCSMNEENKGLFNKDAFSKMKSDAIFINSSRGVLVNQEDLYDALKSGQIMAAGLDVTSPEPLPVDHQLKTLDNCVIFPHLGSATTDTRNVMAVTAAKNAIAGFKGQTLPSPVPL
ncbi:glyoxylate/hydroxypyruvate reductase [Mytilus galloprovincialis]|uniref:Glyoxylate reductase/hydroxypyruvate reductase n=1 Tax=Mytilus galloprovincialis TaxID=29158 RepID=A0A8B6BQB3_MYTGA|nr:glyoxylate/hydroxypyruvate reductase [Mytilus galloprovincialis]